MPVITAPLRGSPFTIPWAEVGSNLGDFYYQAASQVRDFLCSLHNQDPSGLTGDCNTLDNPLCQIAHSNWNRACAGRQAVPIPSAFTGGQCPIFYNVRMKVSVRDLQDCTIKTFFDNTSSPQPLVGLGPLRGFRFNDITNTRFSDCRQNQETVLIRNLRFLDVSQGLLSISNFPSTINNFDGYYSFLDFLEITPRDGQPDNCGSLPVSYPDTNPVTDEDKRTTIIINNDDGTTFNLGLELTTINNFFDFDLFIGNLDDPSQGGLGVHVDHNGISFDPGGGGFDSPEDFRKGDENDNCKPRKPELPNLEEEPGAEEEEDSEFEYLKIVLTTFPDRFALGNTKQQTNYFAGHVKFNVDGQGYLPPQYIYSSESVFEAPENVKGYVVCFRDGASGTISKFKVKSEEESST